VGHLVINAFAFRDPARLVWPVRRYNVRRTTGAPLTHEDRALIKNAAFGLRSVHAARCSGFGFIVDENEHTIVVPERWELPERAEYDDLVFELAERLTATAEKTAHDAIVAAIVREGLKRHVKSVPSQHLGPLWQDFSRFCVMPAFRANDPFAFCRSFTTTAKRLAGERWAVVVGVSTAVVDGRSIGDYLAGGQAADLADIINWKRALRARRDDAPPSAHSFLVMAIPAHES
jgi:hypothetical protein